MEDGIERFFGEARTFCFRERLPRWGAAIIRVLGAEVALNIVENAESVE